MIFVNVFCLSVITVIAVLMVLSRHKQELSKPGGKILAIGLIMISVFVFFILPLLRSCG